MTGGCSAHFLESDYVISSEIQSFADSHCLKALGDFRASIHVLYHRCCKAEIKLYEGELNDYNLVAEVCPEGKIAPLSDPVDIF